MINSIFQTWPWAKRYHDGFNCGRNAMPRNCARPRPAAFLRVMPRSNISFWVGSTKGKRSVAKELETWDASQLAEEAVILKD